jgi:hypothetical protein
MRNHDLGFVGVTQGKMPTRGEGAPSLFKGKLGIFEVLPKVPGIFEDALIRPDRAPSECVFDFKHKTLFGLSKMPLNEGKASSDWVWQYRSPDAPEGLWISGGSGCPASTFFVANAWFMGFAKISNNITGLGFYSLYNYPEGNMRKAP